VEEKYLEELIEMLKGHNPDALTRVDLKNKRRVERAVEKALSGDKEENPSKKRYETFVIGVTWPRDVLYERIRVRLDRLLDECMIV
jgi:tRNA dimethylallyltransferase